jgi:rare lipoprotein A
VGAGGARTPPGSGSYPPGRDGPDAHPPAHLDEVPDAVPKVEPIRPGGPNKPYEVLGQRYVPLTTDRPFTERGLASWYGKKFQGHQTASGELYNMYAMTAAHPTLPIPSYVRVRNPANGREVIVRVNDRGPFHSGRIIDLSYTAALKLGLLKGVAPVEIERITDDEIRSGAWRQSPAPGETLLAHAQEGDTPAAAPAGPADVQRAEAQDSGSSDAEHRAPSPSSSVPSTDPARPRASIQHARRRVTPTRSNAGDSDSAIASAGRALGSAATTTAAAAPTAVSAGVAFAAAPVAAAVSPADAALAPLRHDSAERASGDAADSSGNDAQNVAAAAGPVATDASAGTSADDAKTLASAAGDGAALANNAATPGDGSPPAPASAATVALAAAGTAATAVPASASSPPIESAAPARAYTAAARGFWVQLGAFREAAGALDFQRRVQSELAGLAPLLAIFDDHHLHRLQAGPYASRSDAASAAEHIRSALRLVPVIVERR